VFVALTTTSGFRHRVVWYVGTSISEEWGSFVCRGGVCPCDGSNVLLLHFDKNKGKVIPVSAMKAYGGAWEKLHSF
jgi:hypothetical protein